MAAYPFQPMANRTLKKGLKVAQKSFPKEHKDNIETKSPPKKNFLPVSNQPSTENNFSSSPTS